MAGERRDGGEYRGRGVKRGMLCEAIEAGGSEGLRLRVDFVWRDDRFGHVISIVDAAGFTQPVLESLEGTPEDDWPPSPPLQSLSIEALTDGRRAALLVGMAGGSHWSASVEASPGASALVFDLACRSARRPEKLGSSYRRIGESATKLEVASRNANVANHGDCLTIVPTEIGSLTTTRWKYILRLD